MWTTWISLALGVNIALSVLATDALAQARTIAPDDLRSVLPQRYADFRVRENLAGSNNRNAISEAVVAFQRAGSNTHVRVHIADLVNNAELYDRFIATAGIVAADVTRAVDALIKRGTERTTLKEAAANWADKTLGDLGLEAPSAQAVGSESVRIGGRERSLSVKELIDQWSVFGKGEIFERFSDVPLGRVAVMSNAAVRTEHEAYGLGIDFSPVAERAKGTGAYFFLHEESIGQFAQGMTEESFPDGAYAKLYRDRNNDVAGWEIYQPQGKYGVLLLGVRGRIGVLVEGMGIDNTNGLKEAFASVPLDKLARLATEASRATTKTTP